MFKRLILKPRQNPDLHPQIESQGVLSPGCPDDPLIEMSGIVKTFRTPAGEFTALKGVTACFYPGEFVAVVGKSGSGKSTLVNMLTGIDHPTAGTVRVGDKYIHKLSEGQMSVWRGRNLGIVFQFFQLLPMLTLLENVMLPMDLCNRFSLAERETRAIDLLSRVGLKEFAHALPAAVSGGQQQSAAIARALANDPPLIIADEPTGNLDARTAESVFEIFTALIQQGKTVIMVTHDAGLAARTGRSLLIADGELVHPQVSQAFPHLSHQRLLWLTHQMQPRQLQPGESFATPAAPGLALVTSGQLEVILNGKPGREEVAAVLRPGEYFSALDLRPNLDAKLFARAAGSQPVEVLALDAANFSQWLQEAPETRQDLQRLAQERSSAWGLPAVPSSLDYSP